MSNPEPTQTYANDSATSSPIDTQLTQPRSVDVLRFRIKIPQTLDQAAKLQKWLESILHTLSGKARQYASNLTYALKATEDEADLLRTQKQVHLQWQADRFAQRLGEMGR